MASTFAGRRKRGRKGRADWGGRRRGGLIPQTLKRKQLQLYGRVANWPYARPIFENLAVYSFAGRENFVEAARPYGGFEAVNSLFEAIWGRIRKFGKIWSKILPKKLKIGPKNGQNLLVWDPFWRASRWIYVVRPYGEAIVRIQTPNCPYPGKISWQPWA